MFKPTIYCVRWPRHGIVKVGYTDVDRWKVFQRRGADVLALWRFQSTAEALRYEDQCHGVLNALGPRAFGTRADARASGLLSGGAGYTECYVVACDIADAELLALLASELVVP